MEAKAKRGLRGVEFIKAVALGVFGKMADGRWHRPGEGARMDGRDGARRRWDLRSQDLRFEAGRGAAGNWRVPRARALPWASYQAGLPDLRTVGEIAAVGSG